MRIYVVEILASCFVVLLVYLVSIPFHFLDDFFRKLAVTTIRSSLTRIYPIYQFIQLCFVRIRIVVVHSFQFFDWVNEFQKMHII